MPPEVLMKDEYGRLLTEFSPKADVWSLGVVLFYLCYSDVPYCQVEDVDSLREEIIGFKKWDIIFLFSFSFSLSFYFLFLEKIAHVNREWRLNMFFFYPINLDQNLKLKKICFLEFHFQKKKLIEYRHY